MQNGDTHGFSLYRGGNDKCVCRSLEKRTIIDLCSYATRTVWFTLSPASFLPTSKGRGRAVVLNKPYFDGLRKITYLLPIIEKGLINTICPLTYPEKASFFKMTSLYFPTGFSTFTRKFTTLGMQTSNLSKSLQIH